MSSTLTARLTDIQPTDYNQQQAMDYDHQQAADNTRDNDQAEQLTLAGIKQIAQNFLDTSLPNPVDAALHQIKDKTSIGREVVSPKSIVTVTLGLIPALLHFQIAVSLAVLLSVYLVFAPGAALLSSLIGSVYQCYASVKVSLDADSATANKDSVHWLSYWSVFAFFSVLDVPATNVTGYHLAKSLALLCLSVQATGATRSLHKHVLAPLAHQISQL
jgi:hypothetical protein